MSMKLRESDARAVDLLLDHAVTSAQGNGNGGNGLTFAAPTAHPGVSNEQIAAVEKVLKLLDVMPAHDPSDDLVQRTLARIGAHADTPMRPASPALLDPASRPHA